METGIFNYHENCSIPHHIPPGQEQDGCPVIVFPKNIHDVTIGRTYTFISVMTRRATYTIDGQVYRVAHAIGLVEQSGTEGDSIDLMLHSPKTMPPTKLGDYLNGDVADQLIALREKLAMAG